MSNIRRFAIALIAGLSFMTANASAASDYSGRIGKIEVRTGYADPAVHKNALVLRDEASSVICVAAPDVENYTHFVSLATAAMLSGKTVLIARGGVLNNQYKCLDIVVTN